MSVDPIIARAQQALAASLREAYYAGRGDAAMSLKDKVLALIDELTAPPPSYEAGAAPPAAETPRAETAEAIVSPLQHEISDSTPIQLPEAHAVPEAHEAPAHAG